MKYEWCRELLEKNRHIIIGGCSGSGKSVAENDLIYNMLLNKPDKNCFVLIDLKQVELINYKDAPHCAGYCDNPNDLYALMLGVERVMDNRLKRMQANREKVSSEPVLWVIIDEFYDICIMSDKRVKKIINRISAVGRAAKVLLLVCTQVCTKQVLEVLANNIDVKIGCRTVTAQDSRNLLKVNGCEKLPQYGKAIVQVCGYNKEVDVPLTPDEKIRERVQYWVDLATPQQTAPAPTQSHSEPQKKKRWWQR